LEVVAVLVEPEVDLVPVSVGSHPGSDGSEGTTIGLPCPGWALTTPARVKTRIMTNSMMVTSFFMVLINTISADSYKKIVSNIIYMICVITIGAPAPGKVIPGKEGRTGSTLLKKRKKGEIGCFIFPGIRS